MFFDDYDKNVYQIKQGNVYDIFSHMKNYLFHTPTDKYTGVKFIFPVQRENVFHSLLGYIEENYKIVSESNAYIMDKNYNYQNKISYDNNCSDVFSRMNYTYHKIKEMNYECKNIVRETVASFMTPFDCVNFGHNLSMILNFIHLYQVMELDCKIVLSEYSKRIPRIVEILHLFFEEDKILWINNNTVYYFHEIYFFTTGSTAFDILKYPLLIEEIKHRAIFHCLKSSAKQGFVASDLDRNRSSYYRKNIFIVKNNTQSNTVTKSNVYQCKEIMKELEHSGWVIINPENMNMIEIITYLIYAKKIVTSYGGILYGNGVFFNRLCKKFILLKDNEKIYYRENEFTPIRVTNTDLDNHKTNFYREIEHRLVAVVGYTGFVGQTLLSQYNQDIDLVSLYNRKNITELKHKHYDKIYFCGMPAEKWRINQNPENDLKILETYKEILNTVHCNQFILFSTIDVYDNTIQQDEDGEKFSTQPYGKHRRQLEEFIQSRFNSYIFRLPALFGQGLKKNALFDLLINNQIEKISLSTAFQWYNMENLLKDIQTNIDLGIKLRNFLSEPVETKKLVECCFKEHKDKCFGTSNFHYNLNSKYGYLTTEHQILKEIFQYSSNERKRKINQELTVSNIAWEPKVQEDYFNILKHWGIQSIEIAPTKIKQWDKLNQDDLNLTLKPKSCQSFLYNTDIQNIFTQEEEFIHHCNKFIPLLSRSGIETIVFGCPSQRSSPPNKLKAISLFRKIGELCQQNNILFCIEPNSKQYNCKWLTNLKDTLAFIQEVNHPHIRINFDTGNYIMEEDKYLQENPDWKRILPFIGSIQISNENLKPITEQFLEQLKTLNIINFIVYTHKRVSLEMKEVNPLIFIHCMNLFTSLFK